MQSLVKVHTVAARSSQCMPAALSPKLSWTTANKVTPLLQTQNSGIQRSSWASLIQIGSACNATQVDYR
jgi:hypothetical protein